MNSIKSAITTIALVATAFSCGPLAIALNEMAELPPFLEKHPFSYDIAVANAEAAHVLGTAYPRHVILDGDGKVAYDFLGYSLDVTDQIDAVIGSLLNEL